MSLEAGATGATSIPTTPASTEASPATPDFMSFVPESFRQESFVQDISKSDKPFDNLFEQFKNAQSKIGQLSQQKPGLEVPGDDATEEAIKNFHKALGVPDTVDGYDFSAPDISKEPQELQDLLKAGASPEYEKMIKEVFHKAGITPKQAKALKEANDNFQIEATKAMLAHAQAEANKAAEAQQESFKKVYGDKAEHVQKIAKETIQKVIPKEILEIGDPDIALYEAMRFIHEKVYKGDTVAFGSASNTGTVSGAEGIQAEIDKIVSTPAYLDKMHKDYEPTQVKVQGLYKLLAEERAKK